MGWSVSIIIQRGNYYYYGKEIRRFRCIEVGIEQSVFVDYKKSKYQFYNEDMYLTKYIDCLKLSR